MTNMSNNLLTKANQAYHKDILTNYLFSFAIWLITFGGIAIASKTLMLPSSGGAPLLHIVYISVVYLMIISIQIVALVPLAIGLWQLFNIVISPHLIELQEKTSASPLDVLNLWVKHNHPKYTQHMINYNVGLLAATAMLLLVTISSLIPQL